ncbi:nucleoside phosphorylase [Streptomyces yaizuensis]|uniref:Uridine phosphorylase n=1 Tax=Streptomyces yaizuensis TaxID=2989713 RepID=A0ABQ5P4C7_9ACTN|nr:nucleoside phosphorylase [Streptomyces sp. YSPA8]GLF97372.1 nucleoside phosphorylase [Streptomyces sp. YSPA8]
MPDPAEHAAYIREREPAATLEDLDGVIMVYQRHMVEHAVSHQVARRLDWVRADLHVLEHQGSKVGICGGFGPGAPAAALVLEQLIALGTRRVITVGTAASLRTDLYPGDLVVCDSALRDEGVSHHYLPPQARIRPSPDLTDRLVESLRALDVPVRRGPGWTTDAPYRETAAEIAGYGSLGVLTADMEAAGVFAVAEYRGIEAAAVFAVADALIGRRPRLDHPGTRNALHTALEAALGAFCTAS